MRRCAENWRKDEGILPRIFGRSKMLERVCLPKERAPFSFSVAVCVLFGTLPDVFLLPPHQDVGTLPHLYLIAFMALF